MNQAARPPLEAVDTEREPKPKIRLVTDPDEEIQSRAGARENSTETETTQRDARRVELARFQAGLARISRRGVAYWTPPTIWDTSRPSLRSVVEYGRRGEYTGPDTLGRKLGTAYAYGVSVPAHAAGYLALWVIERPGRLAVASVVALLVALTPAGQLALWLLAALTEFYTSLLRP